MAPAGRWSTVSGSSRSRWPPPPCACRPRGSVNCLEFVYALNLTRCVGCRMCVHACVAENNQSRNPEIQYIRVLKMPNDGTFDVDKGDHNYAPKSVPQAGSFYMPVQCHQCKNPPCVK